MTSSVAAETTPSSSLEPPARSLETPLTVTVVLGLLLSACSQRTASAESLPATAESGAATHKAQLQPSPLADTSILEVEDNELRRGYGVVDMRYQPCITAEGDSKLRGADCPPGFVIYGPYVSVPANSEIEVTFEVRANQNLELYADVVSQMGKQAIAALNPQVVEAGSTRKLGYRVSLSRAEQFVESRIGVSAGPNEFSISDYTMTVR